MAWRDLTKVISILHYRAPWDKQVLAGNRTRVTCFTGQHSTTSYKQRALQTAYADAIRNLHMAVPVHVAITGLRPGAQAQM
jgi:hypothetical protein